MIFDHLNIINCGVLKEMPFALSRRIRLVNVFALLASIATLPYIFIFFYKGIFLAPVSLFYFLCFTTTWIWNSRKKYHVAKFWLYICAHFYLFTTASTFGREAGEHLILIPVLFGSVLVFEFREKLSLLFAVTFTIFTFLLLEGTGYSLLRIDLTPEEQLEYYYGNLVVTLFCSISIAVFYFYISGKQLEENQVVIDTNKEIERTINYFSTSLFGKNSVDEILWDIAKNCIGRLGFVDCVIYLLDEERNVMVQKAAFGAKNPHDFEIYKPIDIPVGKGIVGHVATTGEPLLVNDTSKDDRYIADDQERLSELAVPLIYNRKVIGIIDSEHPDKGFFEQRHLSVMKIIASLCANKVVRALADEEREKSLKIRLEAEKIKAFDELKSKLFANVSHELRTPLTLIMGTIDRHVTSDDSGDWSLLKRNADRLLRLINQLLDLTKLESGHFQLHPQPEDFISFLRLTISLFSSASAHRNIVLTHNLPDEPLWLNFDRDALEKILFNLISNAIKFTRDDSTVKVEMEYDKYLNLTVSDQGQGIAIDEQEKIFDRFYQVDKSSNLGTGIGLALTKELVELHGGKISVSSELGTGTTFYLSLPLEKTSAGQTEKEPVPLRPDKTGQSVEESQEADLTDHKTILIVEDNEELAAFIKRELQEHFKIHQSYNGKDGVTQAKQLMPDLIISDIMMPVMDGLELCSQLKEDELTSHIPVILLTARADQDSKLEGFTIGADDYITKPFSAKELRARITNLLEQRKLLKEKFGRIISLRPKDIVITNVDEVFIKKVLTLVEDNLGNERFGVNELCREIGTSRMQLHRKLTALTGHSASSFIRNQRLQRAGQLLKGGESVSQTAYAVGFGSLSYFTRAFKDYFGQLPSEYTHDH